MTMYAGEAILIKATTKISTVLADPDTVKVTILLGSIDGTVVQIATDMTKTATGTYEYGWDSVGKVAGIYYAKVVAIKDSLSNWEFVKITLD